MGALRKIEVYQNGELLQEVSLDQEAWVGRDESCVIRLQDRAVSRRHARLTPTAQGVEVENKSEFGWLTINGKDSRFGLIREGDRLELGGYELRIQALKEVAKSVVTERVHDITEPTIQTNMQANHKVVSGESSSSGEALVLSSDVSAVLDENSLKDEAILDGSISTEMPDGVEAMNIDVSTSDALSDPLADNQMGETDEPSVVQTDGNTRVLQKPDTLKAVLAFSSGGNQIEHYTVETSEVILGRSQQCHVVLEDKRSSRKHTKIRKEENRYFVKDLGSANGTMLNGSLLASESEQELNSGDVIQVGDTVLTFQLLQPGYAQIKEQFISVPQGEVSDVATPLSPYSSTPDVPVNSAAYAPLNLSTQTGDIAAPTFDTAKAEKKSMIGGLLDRYRAMNTKQQMMWGVVVLGLVWMLMEEEPEEPVKPRIAIGGKMQPKDAKKSTDKAGAGDKKDAGIPTFDGLTAEQKSYVEAQYQLGFDLFKNREYDKSIFEIEKIFRLLPDYKQAREIHSYAIEGKRQREARDEDKKKKDAEKEMQLKLQALVDQAAVLMEKKKYRQAEAIFPEIELMQPENAAVQEWRKMIAAEQEQIEKDKERLLKEKEEQAKLAAIKKKNWDDYAAAVEPKARGLYYDAIDGLEELLDRDLDDDDLVKKIEADIDSSYQSISDLRDPFIKQAKQLETEGKLNEAFTQYELALKVDPEAEDPVLGMDRIRKILNERSKSIYIEGVFAESYSDFDTAEKKYREVTATAAKDSEYFKKAESRLGKITIFKKPVRETASVPEAPAKEGQTE